MPDPRGIATGLGQGEAQLLGSTATDYYDRLSQLELGKQKKKTKVLGEIKGFDEIDAFHRDVPMLRKQGQDLYTFAQQNIDKIMSNDPETILKFQKMKTDLGSANNLSKDTRERYQQIGASMTNNPDKYSDDAYKYMQEFAEPGMEGVYEFDIDRIRGKQPEFNFETETEDYLGQVKATATGISRFDPKTGEIRSRVKKTFNENDIAKNFFVTSDKSGEQRRDFMMTKVNSLSQPEQEALITKAEQSGLNIHEQYYKDHVMPNYLAKSDIKKVSKPSAGFEKGQKREQMAVDRWDTLDGIANKDEASISKMIGLRDDILGGAIKSYEYDTIGRNTILILRGGKGARGIHKINLGTGNEAKFEINNIFNANRSEADRVVNEELQHLERRTRWPLGIPGTKAEEEAHKEVTLIQQTGTKEGEIAGTDALNRFVEASPNVKSASFELVGNKDHIILKMKTGSDKRVDLTSEDSYQQLFDIYGEGATVKQESLSSNQQSALDAFKSQLGREPNEIERQKILEKYK